MSETLRGKRVLVVGRDYFFYTREIVAELAELTGTEVPFVPIEPAGLGFRLAKKFGLGARGRIERHHRRALRQLQGRSFDVVLFVQMHQLGDLVGLYREAFAGARFVLYYWDSLVTHDYLPWLGQFDDAVTFDPADARRHTRLRLLPLFFAERFRALRSTPPAEADLVFVGAAVSMHRYEQLERMRAQARERGVVLRDYLVVSPFLYVKQLLRGRRLRGVHWRGLPLDRVIALYRGARAVLDLPNNQQAGYTMRTFEALGAHRKLVTTRSDISSEDFYTPGSVFVLDAANPFPSRDFLRSPAEVSPAIERYSLRSWIGRLLEDKRQCQ